MRRPTWIASSWRLGALLQLAGALFAISSLVLLIVRLIAPHGHSRLLATAVLIPATVAGLALAWLGRTVRRKGRRMLGRILNGPRDAALLYVAAKLGLPDLLAGGPMSSEELAQSVKAHAPSLHRVLLCLVVLGVCSEEDDGRFALTPVGESLRARPSGTLRGKAILCGEEYMGAWGALLQTVMTGETAFNHAFGMSQWEHRRQHPELGAYFNAELNVATARATRAIMAAYDFRPFHTIADVGAGHGALLAAVLKAHPSARGILFDLPHVVDRASSDLEAAGVADRCRIVGGDFFEGLPGGADLHVLKSVIHDWNEEKGIKILKNCRKALDEHGRLLLVERVMPVRVNQDPSAIWVDLQMLAASGGQERTEEQYRALLAEAGFSLTRIIPTRASFSIIEAVSQKSLPQSER